MKELTACFVVLALGCAGSVEEDVGSTEGELSVVVFDQGTGGGGGPAPPPAEDAGVDVGPDAMPTCNHEPRDVWMRYRDPVGALEWRHGPIRTSIGCRLRDGTWCNGECYDDNCACEPEPPRRPPPTFVPADSCGDGGAHYTEYGTKDVHCDGTSRNVAISRGVEGGCWHPNGLKVFQILGEYPDHIRQETPPEGSKGYAFYPDGDNPVHMLYYEYVDGRLRVWVNNSFDEPTVDTVSPNAEGSFDKTASVSVDCGTYALAYPEEVTDEDGACRDATLTYPINSMTYVPLPPLGWAGEAERDQHLADNPELESYVGGGGYTPPPPDSFQTQSISSGGSEPPAAPVTCAESPRLGTLDGKPVCEMSGTSTHPDPYLIPERACATNLWYPAPDQPYCVHDVGAFWYARPVQLATCPLTYRRVGHTNGKVLCQSQLTPTIEEHACPASDRTLADDGEVRCIVGEGPVLGRTWYYRVREIVPDNCPVGYEIMPGSRAGRILCRSTITRTIERHDCSVAQRFTSSSQSYCEMGVESYWVRVRSVVPDTCPLGFEKVSGSRGGDILCRAVLNRYTHVNRCNDADEIDGYCFVGRGDYYWRVRTLTECPWPYENVDGERNGKIYCRSRVDRYIRTSRCSTSNRVGPYCIMSEQGDHYRVKTMVDCPSLYSDRPETYPDGRFVCRSTVTPTIQSHDCSRSRWSGYCVMGSGTTIQGAGYVRVRSVVPDRCPGGRTEIGRISGRPVCRAQPHLRIRRNRCSSWGSVWGGWCIQSRDGYWYSGRQLK